MSNSIYEQASTTNPYNYNIKTSWFAQYAYQKLNTENIPMWEIGSRHIYENKYNCVTLQKIIDLKRVEEPLEIVDRHFFVVKHRSAFKDYELCYLTKKIDEIFSGEFEISEHVMKVKKLRRIDIQKLKKNINKYEIVNFRLVFDDYNSYEDQRVTLRYDYLKGKPYIYLVLSLDLRRIVTVYSNKIDYCNHMSYKETLRCDDTIDVLGCKDLQLGERINEHPVLKQKRECYKTKVKRKIG